jgi:hypothetical protein
VFQGPCLDGNFKKLPELSSNPRCSNLSNPGFDVLPALGRGRQVIFQKVLIIFLDLHSEDEKLSMNEEVLPPKSCLMK